MNISKKLLVTIVLLMGFFMQGYTQYEKTPRKNQKQNFEEPNANITERKHKEERFPVQYPPLREADVMWQKRVWREIDLIQKNNHPLYFPVEPKHGRASLASYVFDSVKAGNIVAYEPNTPMKFQLPMTPPQFEKMLSLEKQTTVTEQVNGQQIERDTVISMKQKPSDVKRIRLMEDWYFDKERSMFEVRIIGIGFIMEDLKSETGDLKTKFWIYYPHARRALARSENFVHDGNRAQSFSYTAILEKRRFSSLVTKVDNVYDRYIQSYTDQQETLYEAKRLEKEILEFEQNLWEY
ncbi:MAG: gliding motility protein GldN [Bacteroidales bacterium]|nr:gliding motility protein GldN [Bacteroidales bacterium]MCF8332724.1 gliding motility protein GldN [Bacteroidales bacterium]